ncbi:MAG: SEC-C domain-containing protein [Solirubrobacterales bacterium]
MAAIRRNALCPCGSGRKYKQCCLADEESIAASDREDERVWRRIQDWARDRHPDEVRRALDAFAAASGGIPEAQIDLACSWVHLDLELSGGGSLAQRYAEREDLSGREREIARRIAAARLGLHRVLAAEPGAAIELEDVTRGSRVRVRSANVSRHAVTWDLLLGRVMDGEPEPSLWGPVAFYDPNEEAELLAEVERLAAALGVDPDDEGFAAVFRARALELLRFVPPSRSIEPVFVSVEGDPAAHSEATWAIADQIEALEALDAPPELIWMGPDPERDCFAWALPLREVLRGRRGLPRGAVVLECTPLSVSEEPTLALEGRIAVGSFEVESGELSFMALSEARLDAACELVERRLGKRARLLRREITALEADRVRDRVESAPPKPRDPDVPEEAARELVEAQLERQYRRFLEEPQARLGGLTPREATASAEYADELATLVRGIENSAERARRRGDAFPDVAWIRAELGLDAGRLAA